MRLNPLYDKIAAATILFLVILFTWNASSPPPMPITQPRIFGTYSDTLAYPYAIKSIKVSVLAGKAEIFFLVYHPPTFKDSINSVIYIEIYLTNYTPSFIGKGISLAFVDVKLVYENDTSDPPYVPIRTFLDSEPDDILSGMIDLDCNRIGIYNVTIRITVQILSIFIIGWLPDKVITQQLTTQINITST